MEYLVSVGESVRRWRRALAPGSIEPERIRQSSDLVSRAGELLLRWRWPLVAFAGLFNIVVETVEEMPSLDTGMSVFYPIEVVLFGLLGPLCGGLALTLIAQSRERQQRADRFLAQHKELVASLSTASDWSKLTALVVRFPRTVVDLRGVCLLVFDGIRRRYELDRQWWDLDEVMPPAREALCTSERCTACYPEAVTSPRQIFPAPCPRLAKNDNPCDRYCLPLVCGSQPVALIYLYLAPGTSLSEEQIETLSTMAASAAIAMHDAQPHRDAAIRASATHAERQRVARDLHDTLGQSLSYLRLKLDQLTGDNPLHEILVVRQELEQMRAVAANAYLQMRRTISALQPPLAGDLTAAVEEQARQFAERAPFELEMTSEGMPRPLPAQTQRQVLFLLREALNNVEKHAGASCVETRLAWEHDRLEIRLSDDGRGFDPAVVVQSSGHLGLSIMQQRALSIDAQLTISSAPGLGTEISLLLPIGPGPSSEGEVP